MKISEVEEVVGLSKKNIRFYEQQGLLSPARSENGYRTYTPEQVARLRQIKLLRKLALPLEAIRTLSPDGQNWHDTLRAHTHFLQEEIGQLTQAEALCRQLLAQPTQPDAEQTVDLLTRMDALEQQGARFVNIDVRDRAIGYIAPVTVCVLMLALAGAVCYGIVWLLARRMVPFLPGVLLFLVPAGLIVAIVMVLLDRISEIKRGELDAASQY